MSESYFQRLSTKTPERKFLYILENEYEYSPKESRLILEEVRQIFDKDKLKVQLGQRHQVLVSRKAKHGKPIKDLPKVEVVFTVDAGLEDLEIEAQYGQKALRRMRILRLIDEAVDQGGDPTEEDLARALNVTPRTIRRDIKELRKQGYRLNLRGYTKGIGRGVSHKVYIVELYLNRYTYSEISLKKRHSLYAIQRYIETFSRVVYLLRKGFKLPEIAFLVGISQRLTAEYIALYKQYSLPQYEDKLNEICEIGAVELKKGG